jgi:hypothetical protein
MFPASDLGEFASLLPCDSHGRLPSPGDDWREMEWNVEDIDFCDADTVELLDGNWWPTLVQLVDDVRGHVSRLRTR